MGLPKSIIRKYGVSKKAWAVYRGQSKTSGSRSERRTRVKTTMAKRRRSKSRGGFRGFVKKNYSRKSGVSPEGLILPAAVYGAVRSKASELLQPITAKVPLGGVADELVLGTAAYFLAKKSNNKMVKDFARAALTVEAAQLGQALMNGSVFGGTGAGGVQNY